MAPYKVSRRIRDTALVYCEGADDCAFANHLKKMYSCESKIFVTIKLGTGGSLVYLVEKASKITGNFGKRYVLADIDRDKAQAEISKAELLAQKYDITILKQIPCLEAILLLILGYKSLKNSSTKSCKTEFKTKYISEKHQTDSAHYAKLFPRNVLDKKRKKTLILDTLIRLFEGKLI